MDTIKKFIADSIVKAFLFIMRLRTKKYPKKLLQARREAFKKQIDKHNQTKGE